MDFDLSSVITPQQMSDTSDIQIAGSFEGNRFREQLTFQQRIFDQF